MEIGDRVFALLGANPDEGLILILGGGTYGGCEVPPPNVRGAFGVPVHYLDEEIPKITLDSGDVVWGCEVYWGPEVEISSEVARRQSDGWMVKKVAVTELGSRVAATDEEVNFIRSIGENVKALASGALDGSPEAAASLESVGKELKRLLKGDS